MLEVHQFPCLTDNYGFLLHDPDSGETAAIAGMAVWMAEAGDWLGED